MTRQEEKQTLRGIMKRLEQQLSPTYRERADRSIAAHLLAMPEYQEAQTVFCFVSTPREINTRPILEDILRSGKQLCVPLCVDKGVMETRLVTDLSQLRPGAYGLMEPPADAPLVCVDDIDFAVLPCTTCNHLGQRLGKGGGYYDRFLQKVACAHAAVCLESFLFPSVPAEPHDQTMKCIVTQHCVLRFEEV